MRAIQMKWNVAIPIALITFIITYASLDFIYEKYQKWTDVLRKSDCTTEYLTNSKLKQTLKYCNSLNKKPVQGYEGKTDGEFYKLELVQVIIRHGDRAPIFSLPNYETPSIPCDEHEILNEKAPFYSKFKEHLSQEKSKRGKKQTFSSYDLYPNKEACTPSMLTPEGAAQHVKNGKMFNEAYLGPKWKLFPSDDPYDKVKMISTTRSRTFQSGVAFMYGFLPNLDLPKLNIEAALDTKMCLNGTKFPCGCPAISAFFELMSFNWKQTSPKFTSNKFLMTANRDIANVLGLTLKEVPRATHVADVLMAHACHGLPLPGKNGQCVEPSTMLNLRAALAENGRASQKSPSFKRAARLRSMPLLHDIYRRMKGLENEETKEKFILYSGHDTTLEPLISTLGVTTGAWPPYASRLVFETYSFDHTGHKHFLMRILFNGIDVTPDVIFCRADQNEMVLNDDGLCPFDELEAFINEESMKDIHPSKTYRELCAEKLN